ncbi:MAG: D-alanine--D-alanine ligase [Clostridia bacterium]|nr:D-alanine--D-alanine ligase [Clostridia bacterium]
MAERIKINVGVIFGGRSVEHEVSIISGQQAMAALDQEKYHAVPIYIAKDGQWYSGEALADVASFREMKKLLAAAIPVELSVNFGQKELVERSGSRLKKPWRQRIDVALPVGHGTSVEDGCLQGLLEMAGIPYAGPGVLSSAVGMDKIMMKAVLRENNLPVVDYLAYSSWQWHEDGERLVAEIKEKLGLPLVVKPANLGSSIGISRVADEQALAEAIELAASFSDRLIVEKAVQPLREINCAVLGAPGQTVASVCEEPMAAADILSFADKYLNAGPAKGMSGSKRRILDADDALALRLQDLAQQAFAALDCRGVCRVDFLINEASGDIFVNELNTIPGSLAFYLFEPAGLAFDALVERLIHIALERQRQQERLITVYASNILAQGSFKGKK